MEADPPALTERFLAAVALAVQIHGHERRTGTEIPYLAHLLVVTGLVIEDGGDEDQAIAAMLHDGVEDGGGRALLERIAGSFGSRVAVIVQGCSDSVEIDPTDTWIERKRRNLAHLPGVKDDAILRVALADKVNNASSIVRDYREEGHALWERFTQKTAREQLWYYGGLLAFFEHRRPGPLTEDLRRAVGELAWLVARVGQPRLSRFGSCPTTPTCLPPYPRNGYLLQPDSRRVHRRRQATAPETRSRGQTGSDHTLRGAESATNGDVSSLTSPPRSEIAREPNSAASRAKPKFRSGRPLRHRGPSRVGF